MQIIRTLGALIGAVVDVTAVAAPRAVPGRQRTGRGPDRSPSCPTAAGSSTNVPGRLRIVGTGFKLGPPLAGLPAVDAGGQFGLLDFAVDPQFADNRRVYWS